MHGPEQLVLTKNSSCLRRKPADAANKETVWHSYTAKGKFTATVTAKCQNSSISKTAQATVTAFSVTISEVSFTGLNKTIKEDKPGSALEIHNPIWVDADLDGQPDLVPGSTTERQDKPAAYVRNNFATLNAKFGVEPPLNQTLTGIKMEAAGNGLRFHGVLQPFSGNEATLADVNSDQLLPNHIAYYNPLVLQWRSSSDGLNLADSGITKHGLHVLLADPVEVAAGSLYRTTLLLATCCTQGTTPQEAIEGTWSRFANTNETPRDMTGWDGRLLAYYPQGASFSSCATDATQLLLSQSGSGQCNSFAQVFREALLANGIKSKTIGVAGPSLHRILVKDWDFLTESYSGTTYPYRAFFRSESDGGAGACVGSQNLNAVGPPGMVPKCPNDIYGDLRSKVGLAAQNSGTPSEKLFGSHYIVRVILGLDGNGDDLYEPLYRDPSYAKTYTGESGFQSKAVSAFCKTNPNPPPLGTGSPMDLLCRKPSSGTEISFVPIN